MPTAVLVLLLAAVLSILCSTVQKRVRSVLEHRPGWIWAVPFLLSGVFCASALLIGAWTPPLTLLALGYTAAPVLCVWLAGPGPAERPAVLDFAAILLLWLPLEFAAGAGLVPRPAQGYLHRVAYGIAILLGLLLFLGNRSFPGMKFNLPRSARDVWLPLAGFAVSAPVLIALGISIGFLPPAHRPTQSAGAMASAVGVIFFGTALPEEILFRSLIQNLLMLRFGSGWRTLVAASFIFGAAHLDNGPQALPNWRYMILATVAGVAYGAVFQRASSVLSPAALHMLVDWSKHFFF